MSTVLKETADSNGRKPATAAVKRAISAMVKVPEKSSKPHPYSVSPRNIGSFRWRKPSYVVRDIVANSDMKPEQVAKILTARGVPRLFALRKELFALRKQLQESISEAYSLIHDGSIPRPKSKVSHEVREYYEALGSCRTLAMINRHLEMLLTPTGLDLPSNDPEFEKLLHVRGKDLFKAV